MSGRSRQHTNQPWQWKRGFGARAVIPIEHHHPAIFEA